MKIASIAHLSSFYFATSSINSNHSRKEARSRAGHALIRLLIGFTLFNVVLAEEMPANHKFPLFSDRSTNYSNVTQPIKFLHTSLSTLLPMLPILSPAPEHTLLLTLATPAFKPLLYNWICYLKYKAKWGQAANLEDNGLLKLLVVTSDEEFAKELSEKKVVVWWLRGINLNS